MKKRLWLLGVTVLVVASILGASWMFLGYWWNPFASPCSLSSEQSRRSEIQSPWLLPFGTDIIENDGMLCFYPARSGNPPTNNLSVQVYSSGCYSSSCSIVYERAGQIKIDQAAFAIHLSSRFAVKPLGYQRFGTKWACGCTADCGGAGMLEYQTGNLQDGTYQVYLGETRLGSFSLPLTHDLCLEKDHPDRIGPGPTAAYPPANIEPIPYPVPVITLPPVAMPYPEPALPTPTPELRPTPTWYGPVITIPLDVPKHTILLAGEWLSSTLLSIEAQGYSSAAVYWADLKAGAPVVSSPSARPFNQSLSASGSYAVQCGSLLQMVDLPGGKAISQSDLILNPHAPTACEQYASWAGNEMAAFTAGIEGDWSTYVWRTDGSAPRRIGPALTGAAAPAWSPDFHQLAFLSWGDSPAPKKQLLITGPDGSPVQTIPITTSAPFVSFHWLSPQVIALSAGEEDWRFYALPEADLLFTWQQVSGIVLNLYSDFPSLSPDGHWLVLERHLADAPEEKQFSLYDLQSRQEIPLYQGKGHQLEVSAWSPDSQMLYLLHYPTNPEVERDPNLPFGLLAYTPLAGQFETLVMDARYVQWNHTVQRAMVYYQPGGGKISFAAGIWDVNRKYVSGAYPLRADFPVFNPTIHAITLREFIPAAWSPDGELAAFFTWSGELVLMDLDGQTRLLADQIGLWRSDFIRFLAWSPDGSRLFASDRSTAWVVEIFPMNFLPGNGPAAGGRE